MFGHSLDKPQAWHTCRTPPSHCVLMHVELARGFLQLHHMAFLQNSIFTLLLHLYWYIKYTWNPNKHCLIDASRRCLALALSRLAGARATAPAAGSGRRVVVRNGDFSDNEHNGWKDTDTGLLSKVFGLVLNYEQREEDPLYIQCVWPCCHFLEEDVQLGLLSFQRWIIIHVSITAYRHPSNRATCYIDLSIHQMPQKPLFKACNELMIWSARSGLRKTKKVD